MCIRDRVKRVCNDDGGRGMGLITIKDMCKIYNPGENEVRALDHVNLTICLFYTSRCV